MKKATGSRRKEYLRKYAVDNYTQVKFQLRKDNPEDQRILARIREQENVSEYIRSLIRKDVENK